MGARFITQEDISHIMRKNKKFKLKKASNLIEKGKLEEALDYCRFFLNSANMINQVSEDSHFFETVAEIHYLEDLYSVAIQYANQALSLNPSSLTSYAILFNIYDRKEKFDKALNILEQSVHLDEFPVPNQQNKDFHLNAIRGFSMPIIEDLDWNHAQKFIYYTIRPKELFIFFIETNLELTRLASTEFKEKAREILKQKFE